MSEHHRTERIVLETDRYRMTGTLTLPRAGYRSRLSDFLNAGEREFLSLTDVTVETLDGDDPPREHGFLLVAHSAVTQVRPDR